MKIVDKVLIAVCALYVIFVGPALISDDSWVSVGLGLFILGVLIGLVSRRVRDYLKEKSK